MKFIFCSNRIFKERKRTFITFVIILVIILSFNPFINYNYNLDKHHIIVENENLRVSNTGDNIFRLIYGTLDGPTDLDPHNAWDRLSIEVIDQVCEGLYAYNISDPGLPIIPILAEDIGTLSSDAKNYTVHLRQDVIFHDNTLFNATAVKWSFDRLNYLIQNNKSKIAELYLFYNSTLKEYVPYIKEVRILNEYTVNFLFNEPFPYIETLLCSPSSYILSPLSTPENDIINTVSGDLVGTGPFVYDYYKPNDKVKFHAFENYRGGVSNVSLLEFSIIKDEMSRNLALLTGDVDIISDPLKSLVPTFVANEDTNLINSSNTLTCKYLGMNNYWINNTFRKAISHAINYSYISEHLMRENVLRLKSPVPSGVPGYNSSVSPPELNISYARGIMQTMGFGVGWNTTYPGTDENLWTTATFGSFNYTYYNGDWVLEELFNVLYNNLSRIGIEIIKTNTTYKNYLKYLFNDAGFNRNMLQIFWFSWDAPYLDTSMYLNPLFTNRSDSANFIQYNGGYGQNGPFKPYGTYNYDSNKDVQKIMEQAIVETDFLARINMYKKIQSLIVERDFACGFLFEDTNYYAYRNHILGFTPNSLGKLHFHKLVQDSAKNPRKTIYLDGNIDWYFFKNFGNCIGFGNLTDPYVIKDFEIANEPSKSCILIENSDVYFKIENCTFYNSYKGIELVNVKNALLHDNNCSNNSYGISITNCTYVNTTKNIINFNDEYGINLNNSDNNTISGNTVSNNTYGIESDTSNNNTISGNTIYNNGVGIYLSYTNNSSVSGNTIYNNDYGIALSGANDNTISGNNATYNQWFGILLQLSNYSTIIHNTINNNSYYGIGLITSVNSLIFNNSFIGNTINALDNGTNNQWDNGFIGNFWDDYGGVDANDDGIGDTPYLILGSANSQDNFPIWDDGESIVPIIIIYSPVQNEQFKITPPNFNISIDEINLDSTWYYLSNGTYQTNNYIFSGLTGQINQLAWDVYVSGSIVITFCANDTAGNIGYQAVTVKKISEYYILNPLIIDDTGAGNYTWSEAVTKSWCFGLGLSNNPFVIEYVMINGQNTFNCIEIRNSNAIFIIRNCIFYNGEAGIKLTNTTNGQLLFNNCSNNNGNGICLNQSYSIIISGNIANSNNKTGIELLFSNFNLIKENSINNNTINGISLINSTNNEILDNNETINDNGFYGIYLNFSDYNNISNNVINYNEKYGIYLIESDYNYIGGNTLLGNKEGAIKEENCDGNVFEDNTTKISNGFQIPLELIILLCIVGAVAIVVPAGAIAYKKKVSLPKKKKKMKQKLEKREIITKEKLKIEKREDKAEIRLEKQKKKIENKLQKKLNFVDYLIKENKTEIALQNLNKIESLAKSEGLIEFVNKVEQKLVEIKKLEVDTINRIKQTIVNLGMKFSRLQLSDISEKSDIKNESLIEKIIQEMINKKEIRGEYFASSKALALEVTTPIIAREKAKDVNVFLSYSTLDADHFEISRIVRRLELYPEISNVYFWEVDSGENIVTFMEQTLQKTNVFVLFCSEHSIKSKAVEDEWQAAFQLRKEGLMKMVPVYEKDEHIPYLLKPILNVKFTKDNFDGFIQKLYEEILR